MGLFCEERKVKGRKGGARGPRKGGVIGKGEWPLPHPTGYLCRKRCTSSPWVIKCCGSWCYGWRSMVHGGSRGGSSRAYAYAHILCVAIFFKKPVFRPDGWGLKGGGWRKTRKRRTGLCPNGTGIMALFIFGIKRAGKKDGLLSKK